MVRDLDHVNIQFPALVCRVRAVGIGKPPAFFTLDVAREEDLNALVSQHQGNGVVVDVRPGGLGVSAPGAQDLDPGLLARPLHALGDLDQGAGVVHSGRKLSPLAHAAGGGRGGARVSIPPEFVDREFVAGKDGGETEEVVIVGVRQDHEVEGRDVLVPEHVDDSVRVAGVWGTGRLPPAATVDKHVLPYAAAAGWKGDQDRVSLPNIDDCDLDGRLPNCG